MAPFFGRRNELFEAGLPEDSAHYGQDKHWVYLWTVPLKLAPLPATPRDELLQTSAGYEGYFAREALEDRFEEGRATAADIRALIASCKQYADPGEDCAARYQPEDAGKP
jgi:hypothetical protein